jgi:outer membrane protein assembly factor BamB
MASFQSSDNEREVVLDDDDIQFEDLDVPGTQLPERWERYLQHLFTPRSRRYWQVVAIVTICACLLLVLAPLLPSQSRSLVPVIADPIHSSLEVVTPQFVYEVQNEPGIIRALRRSNGSQVWSYQVLASVNDALTLTLAINPLVLADNILYTHVYKGRDSTLYALNALNGTLLWTYRPLKPFTPLSFVVVHGIAYDSSLQGGVVALQSQTGKPLWSYKQPGQQLINDMRFNLVNGVIYLSFTQERQTIALDALTGVSLWQSYRYLMYIGMSSNISYFGDLQNTLYALQSRTGAILWISAPSFLEQLYAIGAGDLLFYGQSNGSVEALHIKTAHLAWRSKPIGFPISALLLSTNHLYVVNSDVKHSVLLSLDPSSGNVLWQANNNAFPQLESIGDHIYVETARQIDALKVETGQLLWHASLGISLVGIGATSETDTDSTSDLAFQVADNHLFITVPDQNNNVLVVLNDSTGSALWRKAVSGTPLLLASSVYVAGTDGGVYACAGNTGKQIWSML